MTGTFLSLDDADCLRHDLRVRRGYAMSPKAIASIVTPRKSPTVMKHDSSASFTTAYTQRVRRPLEFRDH